MLEQLIYGMDSLSFDANNLLIDHSSLAEGPQLSLLSVLFLQHFTTNLRGGYQSRCLVEK